MNDGPSPHRSWITCARAISSIRTRSGSRRSSALRFSQCFCGSDWDIQSRQKGHQGFPQASQASSSLGSQKVISSTGNSRLHLRHLSDRDVTLLILLLFGEFSATHNLAVPDLYVPLPGTARALIEKLRLAITGSEL